jgi:two-component system, chemotaxis family, sensor kinase CheA
VKPLGNYVGEVKGIAGATILGDGQVALILDVPTLIRSSLQR